MKVKIMKKLMLGFTQLLFHWIKKIVIVTNLHVWSVHPHKYMHMTYTYIYTYITCEYIHTYTTCELDKQA